MLTGSIVPVSTGSFQAGDSPARKRARCPTRSSLFQVSSLPAILITRPINSTKFHFPFENAILVQSSVVKGCHLICGYFGRLDMQSNKIKSQAQFLMKTSEL